MYSVDKHAYTCMYMYIMAGYTAIGAGEGRRTLDGAVCPALEAVGRDHVSSYQLADEDECHGHL